MEVAIIIVAKLSDTAVMAIAIINDENVLRLLKAILRTMKNSRFNAWPDLRPNIYKRVWPVRI